MSLPKITPLTCPEAPELEGFRYDFAKAGDLLPMHSHTSETAHDIRCTVGSCVVSSPKDAKHWNVTLQAGDHRKLAAGPHEVRALEDGTRTIHIPLRIVAQSAP